MKMNLFSSPDEETLFCFSPPVMLFTFIVEFSFAIYILLSSKLKQSSLLIISILVCLGVFQLAEYQVCSDRSLIWMRVGYIAITLLPPLGVHLISLVTNKVWYRYISYSLAALFVAAFIISTQTINSAICGGNYIMVVTSGNFISYFFPYYYYLLLAIGLLNISEYMNSQRDVSVRDHAKNRYLFWIAFGYASFIVPTATVYFLSESARSGIPSIMCGFAIFLAIILTLKVYPLGKKIGI